MFHNFLLRWILSFYEIEVFFWKCKHVEVFQFYFPFLDKGHTVNICLVGGVVIFHEARAVMGIDSWVYVSEHGSRSYFGWQRSQSGRTHYLFRTKVCWYSWYRLWSALWGKVFCLCSRELMPVGKDLWIYSSTSYMLKLCIPMTKFLKLSTLSYVLWTEYFA